MMMFEDEDPSLASEQHADEDEAITQPVEDEEEEEEAAEEEELPVNGSSATEATDGDFSAHFEDTSESGGTDTSQDWGGTPSRGSRELKSILALSKEAKLDTNLTPRRKTLEQKKPTEQPTSKRPVKNFFPVTAECEIEHSDDDDDDNKSLHKIRKNKQQNVSDSSAEGAADTPARKMLPPKLVMLKPNKDMFCWRCHHDNVNIACETCPRAYHQKCLKQTVVDTEHWPCPECVSILKAENTQTRSKAVKGMTLEHLCGLLKFAVKRMKQCDGSEPFVHPVDSEAFPEYKHYIVYPMNLSTLEQNIKANVYGSTQAFEADAKWILHNSIIFNSWGTKSRADIDQDKNTLRKEMTSPRLTTDQSKLTSAAKSIVKICKQEMAEIENCPSCYMNANTKKHTWFVEVCPKPHLLVWAKLKGFPYWPAKVMSISSSGMADVRFFGAHDKAWISTKDCYMYSSKDPNSGKQKRNDIMECVRELEIYVENLRHVYGRVNYYPFKMALESGKEMTYLKMFLPSFTGEGKKVDLEANDVEPEIREQRTEDEAEICELSHSDKSDDKIEETVSEDVPKTNLELKSVSVKPKWVVKPLKTVMIRKRHSEYVSETARKMQRRESGQSPSASESEAKTPTKLKITYQLIKKLATNENDDDDDPKEEVEEEKKLEEKAVEIIPEKVTETEKPVNEEQSVEPEIPPKSPEVAEVIKEPEIEDDEGKEDEDCNNHEVIALELVETVVNEPPKSEKPVEILPQPTKRKREDQPRSRLLIPPNKMVKLVPIENILQKKDPPSPKITGGIKSSSNKQKQLIVLKEIRVVKDGGDRKSSGNQGKVVKEVDPTATVTIKNEVESGDEDNNDSQYMEAKRQYMSALNISEKQKVPNKPKQHAIRTRSKTGEKRSRLSAPITLTINSSDAATGLSESGKKRAPHDEICIKSLSKLQAPKSKARKSFPSPNYPRKSLGKAILPKPPDDSLRLRNVEAVATVAPNLVLLPKLHYAKGPQQPTALPPMVTLPSDAVVVVQKQPQSLLPCPPLTSSVPSTSRTSTTKHDESQNYIPQKDTTGQNNLLVNGAVPVAPSAGDGELQTRLDNELGVLKEILPENVAKGVSEILCQPPPPKLKPKPFGILHSVGESAAPSTAAGPVSTRINNVSQKLADYFRGLLVETVNELGKSNNHEATITGLRLEIEELNHRHCTELLEIRRNVSVVLKDIQKSIHEERDKTINETKANCEAEMQKRVDEAKSKQWCANCQKEAQFYCCWNTSYCDYPCQQKHWPKHVNKCTQNTSGGNNNQPTNQASSSAKSSGQPLVLTSTSSPKYGALYAKPQKVYLKRSGSSFKQQAGGNKHITLVESTPGNFELVGSGSIAVNGKILASTSVIEKIKSGNIVTVTAPSSGVNTESTNTVQKVTITPKAISSRNPPSSSESEH